MNPFIIRATVILTIIACVGWYVTNLKNEISILEKDKVILSGNVSILQKTIDEQNESILKIKIASEELVKKNKQNLAIAESKAMVISKRSEEIISRKPSGSDLCASSNYLINETLGLK